MIAMPAHADLPEGVFTGGVRDTSDASKWMVKRLGAPMDQKGNIGSDNGWNNACGDKGCRPDEAYNWATHRTYNNGVLDTTGYQQAITPKNQDGYWDKNHPWITSSDSPKGTLDGKDLYNGFYSYVTIYANDFSKLGQYQEVTFTGLTINLFAWDDHLDAIVINGIQYDNLLPSQSGQSWHGNSSASILFNDASNWNIFGPNTIEFVVHNTNSGDPEFWNNLNPSGFSASMQATYQITAVPEPETYAMMLAGLGIIGAVARCRRNRKQ